MGLRIATNVASESVQKNLLKTNQQSAHELEKLSSGKRITKSADDAAGLAIAKTLEGQTKSLRMARQNSNSGISLIQTIEGGLDEVSSILVRLRELGIQGASDTVGERERDYLNREYQQLVMEIDRIAESTKFGGQAILKGEGSGQMDFHVGAYGGKENVISFNSDITDARTRSIGIRGSGLFSKDDAADSISSVDEAIQNIASQRATLGSVQSRLQTTSSNLDTQVSNLEAARSQIEDVDVAESTSRLVSNNILKEAGVSALAQAQGLPKSALRLIS